MARITVDRQERTAPAKTERRNAPRMTVKGLAYVNLAPDNGGVVLNVSEGGLCFQCRAPVRRVDSIRFWFFHGSQRVEARIGLAGTNEQNHGGVSRFIEVCSELTWTDETRKIGGLRFKNLPEAARQQIRDWMYQPTFVRVNDRPTLPPPRLPSVKRSYKSLALVRLAKLAERFSHMRRARLWRGYSGGLVSGMLLSAALVGLFSFLIQSHKLGDSLVHLGEMLGGRRLPPPPPANSQASLAPSPGPEPAPPEQKAALAEPPALEAPIQDPPAEKLPSNVRSAVVQPRELGLKPAGREKPSPTRAVTRPSVTRTVLDPAVEPDPDILLAPSAEVPLASGLVVHSEPSKVSGPVTGPEKYLEVGKFKEKPLADTLVDRISRLDFPVRTSPSSHFFGKSYQVLVGPYGSDSEAEAVHKDLSSHGFTPRSYERGKRDFFLRPGLRVGGTHLPTGECVISWESYNPDSIVKIEDSRGGTVTLEGQWVKRADKYVENAIAFVRNRDGSLALLEVRFSGLRETLVFGKGPDH